MKGSSIIVVSPAIVPIIGAMMPTPSAITDRYVAVGHWSDHIGLDVAVTGATTAAPAAVEQSGRRALHTE
jgi:hypothetical protein